MICSLKVWNRIGLAHSTTMKTNLSMATEETLRPSERKDENCVTWVMRIWFWAAIRSRIFCSTPTNYTDSNFRVWSTPTPEDFRLWQLLRNWEKDNSFRLRLLTLTTILDPKRHRINRLQLQNWKKYDSDHFEFQLRHRLRKWTFYPPSDSDSRVYFDFDSRIRLSYLYIS